MPALARPNIIFVLADTLRADYLGCYGNARVCTPNLDAFARQSVRFTQAYPEALPTIPARRSFHTGRRVYPFHNYRPIKWDIVYLPGWQPLSEEEDTLAENLAGAGYHTGFVTDTLPYFAPAMNFTRGFWQWEFVRGQQQDRWRSPAAVDDRELDRYGDPARIGPRLLQMYRQHRANTGWIHHETQTSTARVFQWAMDFLEDNRRNQPFYLLVDCFDPHEPWEALPSYYERYADPGYQGRTIPHPAYDALENFATEQELRDMVAHYSGLVTLVDTWFGRLMQQLSRLDLDEKTLVIFASDHGTNFADNPDRVVGKPARALYPGVLHVPLLIRHPGGLGAGTTVDDLVYNIDVTATIYAATGVSSEEGVDGCDLLPCIEQGTGTGRAYLTCRYSDHVWYRDEQYWIFCNLHGENRHVFDLQHDPRCQYNLAGGSETASPVFDRAWQRILGDAGGELPSYDRMKRTEADGQAARAPRTA